MSRIKWVGGEWPEWLTGLGAFGWMGLLPALVTIITPPSSLHSHRSGATYHLPRVFFFFCSR